MIDIFVPRMLTFKAILAQKKANKKKNNFLLAFYKYPDSIQKSIYTTNWIERANKEIRKRLKTMNSLPNKKAVEKILYLKILD